MPAPPSAFDVERRKKVRIRIRRDLDIHKQKYEGRTYYVVKDPVSLRYYRFKEQERFLIDLMDGKHTLDDAQKAYEKRFSPERLTLEDLEAFAQQLLTSGLAQNESPQAGKQLFDRRKKRRRSEWMQTLTNILYIKIPIFDPDWLLNWMLPKLRWIFTITFSLVSVAIMLAAIMLVATHFETFYEKLPSYHEFFSFGTVAYLWLALGLVKVIHEFGHGLSCKAFGGEVHEMGALFLVFSPCLYCNVSDAWTLPSKWKRIIISFAGIYVELIIAAISTFVWWNTPASPFINNLSLSLMIVCSVSTVVFNANPLMRYDGYYILADWLEIPNLRDRANRFLTRLAMEHCLGIEVQPEPYMALWRRIMFVFYAVVSYVYRWVVTFSILYVMSRFLEPYKLGVISGMLALASAGSMLGWPIYRLFKNVYKRGRLPDMKTWRVTLSSFAVAGVLLFIFLVPLPVSRIRELGVVQVQPEYLSKVVVPYSAKFPAFLKELRVYDGQRVRKNEVLAVFSSIELKNQLSEARTKQRINSTLYDSLSQIDLSGADSDERSRLKGRINDALSEREKSSEDVRTFEDLGRSLELVAPQDGVVMSPPSQDEVGRMFEEGTPFCSIGDPAKLRVLIPVPTKEFRILEGDYLKTKKQGKDLSATIRVKGMAERTWHGQISQMPESEARDVPVQLTTRGGGTLAIKPSSQKNAYVPQAQVFLVGVDILDSDLTMAPGSLAYVKVHCRWRTTAWFAWRAFSSAFDLGVDWRDVLPRVLHEDD